MLQRHHLGPGRRRPASCATLLSGAFFPLLALSTIGYEVWLWLREDRSAFRY